jgi:hypothetical protein
VTCFPFLEIARDFGASYQDVIRLADVIDVFDLVGPSYSRHITEAICLALLAEHDRRKANSAPPKLSATSSDPNVTPWAEDLHELYTGSLHRGAALPSLSSHIVDTDAVLLLKDH